MIHNFQLPSDISDLKSQRVAQMLKWNLTVQPYVIVTSLTELELDGFYVTIAEKVIYKLPNMFEALKFCFEAFFVFNIKYSFESENIWTLLQKLLWSCSTKTDRKFATGEHLVKLYGKPENIDQSNKSQEAASSSS